MSSLTDRLLPTQRRPGRGAAIPSAAWTELRPPSPVRGLARMDAVVHGARIIGLILVSSALAGTVRSLRARRKRRLEALVAERAADVTREVARILAMQEDLLRMACSDPVTGLLIRGELERRTRSRIRSHDGPVAVAVIDVDRFKILNDRYGHLDGDEVLSRLGSLIRLNLRTSDFAGRYGGDELVVVLDDRDGNAGMRASFLHDSIRSLLVVTTRNTITVTCSMGVTWIEDGDDWAALIERADRAMYEAKAGGRDAVVFGCRDHEDHERKRPADGGRASGSPRAVAGNVGGYCG